MGLLAVVNPSRRRRRRRKASAKRRTHRRMTAKQLKYFGPRKAKRRARRRTITMSANPIRRGRRVRRASRRFRRNPIGSAGLRASLGSVQRAAVNAATGAGGAILTDMAMAQAARVLPASMLSRFTADGGVNWGYYGAKAGIAVGLGILGARFLPGRFKMLAARGAEGALTVQAYEIARGILPANITLGYMTPGRSAGVAGMGKYLNRNRLSAYLPTGGGMNGVPGYTESRVGEGGVQ